MSVRSRTAHLRAAQWHGERARKKRIVWPTASLTLIIASGSVAALGHLIDRPMLASASSVAGGVSLGSAYQASLVSMSPAAIDAETARIAATGATWLRLDYSDEPAKGVFDYLDDPMVNGARNHGVNVDAILSVPPWARNTDGSVNLSLTGTYMAQEASHLATLGVHTFEILNEPNLDTVASGGITPATYVSLLRTLYGPVHQHDPSAMILAGGSAPTATTASTLSPQDYLAQMYQDGAAGNFDALAIHPYIWPYVPAMAESWNPWTYLPTMHSVMAANGDGSKRIWFTEFGASTSGNSGAVSDSVVALSYTQAFATARTWSWAGPLFVFDWEDSGGNGFGLLDGSGHAKASLASFEAAVGGPASGSAPALPAPTPNQSSLTINSAPSTTMVTRRPWTYTVTTPDPRSNISLAGTLPPGLSFDQNVIWGTPAYGSEGTYSLTFTASDQGVQGPPQSFALVVDQAPVITSWSLAQFTVGTTGHFQMTASANPAPTYTLSGPLPSGLSFANGVISGTPAAGSQGSYPVTATAANGVSPDFVLPMTIRVSPAAPAVNSVSPTGGTAAGGTVVTITGSGFTGATKVIFGLVPAASFQVVSPTQITAISPPEVAAVHNIFVTGPGGTSPAVVGDQYTFHA